MFKIIRFLFKFTYLLFHFLFVILSQFKIIIASKSVKYLHITMSFVPNSLGLKRMSENYEEIKGIDNYKI